MTDRQRGDGVHARQTIQGLLRRFELGGALLELVRQVADPDVEAPVPQPEVDHAAQWYREGNEVHPGSSYPSLHSRTEAHSAATYSVGFQTGKTVCFSFIKREIRSLEGSHLHAVARHRSWLHPVAL